MKVRGIGLEIMVFNATISNIVAISWRSVLLVEVTGKAGEHYSQTLLHNVVSSAPRPERDSNMKLQSTTDGPIVYEGPSTRVL